MVKRNNLVAINSADVPPALSLPPEILSSILCLANQPSRSTNSVRLAHVCQQWRRVLLETSEFWRATVGSVDFEGANPALLMFLLDRSSPRPVEIGTITLSQRNMELLGNHWNRVARVEVQVRGPDELTQLHHLCQFSNMSSLGDLTISFRPTEKSHTDYLLSQWASCNFPLSQAPCFQSSAPSTPLSSVFLHSPSSHFTT